MKAMLMTCCHPWTSTHNNEEKMLLPDSNKIAPLRHSQRSSATSDEHTLKKVEPALSEIEKDRTRTTPSCFIIISIF
jgi:hypothetical protein